MRTRLTVRRANGAVTDVVVTTDVGASIGDVADAFARADAFAPTAAESLRLN